MKRLLFRMMLLAAALCLCACCALAEPEAADAAQENAILALVNGEAVTQEDIVPFAAAYLTKLAEAGYDIGDEAVTAYVQDLALTAAMEDLLVQQDAHAQGFYDFDEQTESWCREQGQAAYSAALADVAERLGEELEQSEEADMLEYALAYAQMLGVTVENYVDVYRKELAMAYYYAWLTQDCPVTDEDVSAAYAQQGGEGEMTEAQRDELSYRIYSQRCSERLRARVDALAEAAEVTIY